MICTDAAGREDSDCTDTAGRDDGDCTDAARREDGDYTVAAAMGDCVLQWLNTQIILPAILCSAIQCILKGLYTVTLQVHCTCTHPSCTCSFFVLLPGFLLPDVHAVCFPGSMVGEIRQETHEA